MEGYDHTKTAEATPRPTSAVTRPHDLKERHHTQAANLKLPRGMTQRNPRTTWLWNLCEPAKITTSEALPTTQRQTVMARPRWTHTSRQHSLEDDTTSTSKYWGRNDRIWLHWLSYRPTVILIDFPKIHWFVIGLMLTCTIHRVKYDMHSQ